MPTSTPLSISPWATLTILNKRRYDALIERYGDLNAAWEVLIGPKGTELLKALGCKEETIHKTLNEISEFNIESYAQFCTKYSIKYISIEDTEYPEQLRGLPDPPIFLYAKGDLSILKKPSIGVVGTRNISPYGKRVTETLVPDLVRAELITISGLALGVDACVAEETLRANGKTIAVLGHGLGAIYPKANARLADRIVEQGGLILTEYPLQVSPDKYTFPARNRIIAGLSLGTIVIEAAKDSGSLITAALALDYGKEVFAVPGQIFDTHFDGTHHLIQQGAQLITCANDILETLGIVTRKTQKSSYAPQTPEEEKLHAVLTTMPQTVDELLEKTQLSINELNTALTLMELKSGVKNIGAGQWVAC